jgi:hypothetical protein
MKMDGLTDKQLLTLLRTEGDSLSRAAVDEFIRRGERMIAPLTAICQQAKDEEAPSQFVHAAYILGAIGTEQCLEGLLALFDRFTSIHLEAEIAIVVGALGRLALKPMLTRMGDRTLTEELRCFSAEALVSLGARHPECRPEVLQGLRAIVADMNEVESVRGCAAVSLLRFAEPEDRQLLESWCTELRESISTAFEKGPDLSRFRRDWLSYYDPQQIVARQRKTTLNTEGDRWAAAARNGAEWVCREIEDILRRYRTRGASTRALEIAREMLQFNIVQWASPPWNWDQEAVTECLFGRFAANCETKSESELREIPAMMIRFMRFWVSEKKLLPGECKRIEEYLVERTGAFVEAAQCPSSQHHVRSLKLPCPCGSGKRFNQCCGS